MAKKRKPEATRIDEADRTLYSSFRGAANSLSHLYTQAMNHQRLSFLAGERHALEKLYQWIARAQEEGAIVTTVDITTYLQNEMEYGTEEVPFPHNFGGPISSSRTAHSDNNNQGKNSVFSNALSRSIEKSLQRCHLGRDLNSSVSGDSMEINADSPGHDLSC